MTTRIVPDSYAAIQLALSACNDGDRVQVRAGTHAEFYLRLQWDGSGYPENVTVEPYPGDEGSVILDDGGAATNYTFVVQGDGFVLAPGFIVTNRNALYGAVHLVAGSCTVSAVVGASHAGVGVQNGGAGNHVNLWYQNAGTKGVWQSSGASALTVTNSVFVASTTGIEDYSNSDVFRHVLVVSTGSYGYYLTHASQAVNCIAYGGTGGDGFYLGNAGVDVDYCGAYGGSFANLFNEAVGTAGANCVTTDPGFEDAGSGDYSLSRSSGYRNIGETIPAVTTDIDGNPRPSGAGYDIGPYEYQYPTAPFQADLIVDPDGDAHEMLLDGPSSAIVSLAAERDTTQPRQTVYGGSEFQTLSLITTEAPQGTLSLRMTLSERATFQGYIDDHLMSGDEIEVYPDSTDGATHTDCVVVGSPVVVDWQEIVHGIFQLDLPVVIVNEAP